MKANAGGVIDPGNVYGRDRLISTLWYTLNELGVLMTAERRIGKTSVLRKMHHKPAPGWLPLFIELESFRSADEFAVAVYRAVQPYLCIGKRAANAAERIYEENEFGTVKKRSGQRPWKLLLTSAVRDILSADTSLRPVFMLDELPYMIENVSRAHDAQAALEVLDMLRSLRQEFRGLRMVFCGSIGLHHVLKGILHDGISAAPVNDMRPVEVPPLETGDAVSPALDLIRGENLESSDPARAAETVAAEADCFPFYIHHIVSSLRDERLHAEPAIIREVVARHLVDSNDPWNLSHYRDRICAYYGGGKTARHVGRILDVLAAASGALSVGQLRDALNGSSPDSDDVDELVRVLRLMERDHYLIRDPEGRVQFRFRLIRRWWTLDRGL